MNKIDFVITWVDGDDPEWRAEREQYTVEKGMDASSARYRDWGLLPYWFRGVERFAPWANRIYFVTWGHVPEWLDTGHPKLRVVNHEEILKEKYRPTFNINAIELNLHRIEGLSEQFVFFNDDTFLIGEMKEEDFFKNGLPRDCCIETALVQDDINNPFANILMNDSALVNMHYDKRKVIRKNWKKWFHPYYGLHLINNLLMLPFQKFSGFKYTHMPSAFLKSSYEKIWREELEILDSVCQNKFRTVFDLNQYVIKYWQYMEGNYIPQSPNIGKFYTIGKEDEEIEKALVLKKSRMLCLNDDSAIQNFEEEKQMISGMFEKMLPQKSSFEKG